MRFSFWLSAMALASVVPAEAQWSTLSLPNYQRLDFVAVASDSRLYVAGGNISPGPMSDHVDILEIQAGQWTTASLGVPRAALGAVALDGRVYFVGGSTTAVPPTPSSQVDMFDESTATWSETQLPFPATRPGVGAAGGKVIVAGGTSTPTSVAQVYDVATGQWEIEPLRGLRLAIPTAYNDRWICFVGGDLPFTGLRSLSVYDALTNAWRHASIPNDVSGAALVGSLLFAHVCPPNPSTQVDVLDLESGAWSSIDLPIARCTSPVGALGPYVVFANGFVPGPTTILGSADIYNTLTGGWTTVNVEPALQRGLAVSQQTNSLFLVGGRLDQTSTQPSSVIDVFSIVPDVGVPYCEPAVPNSTLLPASMGAIGSQRAADNFLTVMAHDAPPGQFGYFLVAALSGATSAPGAQGILCLSNPIGRFFGALQRVDDGGMLAFDVDLTSLPLSPPHSVVAGETWNFQAWFRDVNPSVTSNFSNGLAVTFQ
ncbi:MAG: hypothetical protein GY722_08735 [bacterium]|nr:hypothetical protein [bacterium]